MARIFSVVPSDRTKGNELKLEHRKFHLTIRWNSEGNSPRTSCLERLWSVFLWRYSKPAWTLSSVTYCREPALAQGLDLMISRGPFPYNQHTINKYTISRAVWLGWYFRGWMARKIIAVERDNQK